jgi:hypothetical protein
MARIVPIKNDDLRSLISLEGRPVNLSVGLEGNGSSLQATGTTSASLSYTITAVSSDTNAIVTLGIPDSNLQVGDSITISGATGGGYTGLNGSREIVSVISDTKFSVNVDSSGYAGAYDADSATLAFSHINPTYSSISTSSIDIDVGRAVAVTSITITSNVKGRVTGVIAQNAIGDWIGLSNQDEFSLAVGEGGTSTLNLDGLVLGSGSRVSLTFTPYSQSGQTNPDIGMHINGIEFTADFNFNAKKKLLYCGDSISWSLVGNYKPQDMGYNYSGNRKESSNPYPDYFGDELAAFKLVSSLRSQSDPESIRLVNKGFGGSKLATDQWFATRSGLYTIDWNMMVMQAGVNDATDVQTPLRQLTMAQRIQDMVTKRNDDGRKKYPMVFCTPPSVDDKYDGTSARVCLDQRVLIASESYTAKFDSTSASEINFGTPSGDRIYKIEGDGTNDLEMKGGAADEVYRLDFTTQNDLLTGVAAGSNTKAFIRTLESQQNVDDSPIASAGIVTIDANTTMFVRCVVPDEEYEEIDRASLIGTALAANATTFDASESTIDHFITSVNSSATEILGPTITGVSELIPITNAVPSRNITQFNFGATSTLLTANTNLPAASVIDENDVWLRIKGLLDHSNAGEISWADVNGFYKVVDYTISSNGQRITNIQIQLDTRDGADRKFHETFGLEVSGISKAASAVVTLGASLSGKVVGDKVALIGLEGGDFATSANGLFEITAINSPTEIVINLNSSGFSGTYTTNSGSLSVAEIELFNSRPYLAEFEGTSGNTLAGNNYSFFAHGDNTVGDYKVKVQLSGGEGTQFNLVEGKGIVFSVYQQGNVIFMNEVVSGDITNAGKIIGKDTLSNFFSQTETGLTRLKTVRKVITDTVNAYASSDNVHLVDLYDITDLKSTTESTAGRLIYGSDNYKANAITDASATLLVNDLIEDPVFKATGDSGVNERVTGKRLHRSPEGHKKISTRLYSVISSITIPS